MSSGETEYSTGGDRYPKRFEIYRLEPFGDEPLCYSAHEARELYDSARGLDVISAEDPPRWYLHVLKQNLFIVTFYTAGKTPLREVTWRHIGDELFCRSVIDVFYPEGDPKRRVRFVDVVTVRQEFSTDGVVVVTRESPIDEDMIREVDGVPVDDRRLAVPGFGEWEALLQASAPVDVTRFGWDAIEAADEYAQRCASVGTLRGADRTDGGWQVDAAAASGVAAAIDAVLAGGVPPAGIPLFMRGDARVIPLMVQPDPRVSGRDPWEDRHRLDLFDDQIVQSCEFFYGRQAMPPRLDLAYRGDDRMGAYAAALRAADATRAVWWMTDTRGIVLVQTGDELAGDLTLAMHIVPLGWVWDVKTSRGGERVDLRWSLTDVTDGNDHGE